VLAPLGLARTLSVMPTFRCTAACRHCGTLSNPKQTERLSLEQIVGAIDQAAAAGYELVVFTGGEPTLEDDLLLAGIRRAAGHGISVRLVTNGWWAETRKVAREVLRRYQVAGLAELNLSTGDQHSRFVPVENVISAAAAGVDIGLGTVLVMIEIVEGRDLTQAAVENHPMFARLAKAKRERIGFVESPWMPLSPRRVAEYPPGLAATADNIATRTGCDSILTTTTIQPDGRIGACCGLGMRLIPELQIGRVDDTPIEDADAAAADDFLKRWIRVEGPEKILAWAASKDRSIQWEEMYAHRCQACLRIYRDPAVRSVVARHHHERMPDVLVNEWLMFRYDGAPQPA
jgi:hypothetical protein